MQQRPWGVTSGSGGGGFPRSARGPTRCSREEVDESSSPLPPSFTNKDGGEIYAIVCSPHTHTHTFGAYYRDKFLLHFFVCASVVLLGFIE